MRRAQATYSVPRFFLRQALYFDDWQDDDHTHGLDFCGTEDFDGDACFSTVGREGS